MTIGLERCLQSHSIAQTLNGRALSICRALHLVCDGSSSYRDAAPESRRDFAWRLALRPQKWARRGWRGGRKRHFSDAEAALEPVTAIQRCCDARDLQGHQCQQCLARSGRSHHGLALSLCNNPDASCARNAGQPAAPLDDRGGTIRLVPPRSMNRRRP